MHCPSCNHDNSAERRFCGECGAALAAICAAYVERTQREVLWLRFLHESWHILFHGHEPLDTDTTPTLEGEGWLRPLPRSEKTLHWDATTGMRVR